MAACDHGRTVNLSANIVAPGLSHMSQTGLDPSCGLRPPLAFGYAHGCGQRNFPPDRTSSLFTLGSGPVPPRSRAAVRARGSRPVKPSPSRTCRVDAELGEMTGELWLRRLGCTARGRPRSGHSNRRRSRRACTTRCRRRLLQQQVLRIEDVPQPVHPRRQVADVTGSVLRDGRRTCPPADRHALRVETRILRRAPVEDRAPPRRPSSCGFTPVVSMMQKVVLVPCRGFCELAVDRARGCSSRNRCSARDCARRGTPPCPQGDRRSHRLSSRSRWSTGCFFCPVTGSVVRVLGDELELGVAGIPARRAEFHVGRIAASRCLWAATHGCSVAAQFAPPGRERTRYPQTKTNAHATTLPSTREPARSPSHSRSMMFTLTDQSRGLTALIAAATDTNTIGAACRLHYSSKEVWRPKSRYGNAGFRSI